MRRLTRLVISGIVLVAALSAATPVAAMSTNCSGTTHCYSAKFSGNLSATGMLFSQHNNTLTPGTPNTASTPFMNSEGWFSSGSAWAEVGISNGYNFTLGYWAYSFFTFTRSVSGSDSGWIYLAYTVPDGSDHTYQISRSSSVNRFNVWIDGTGHPPNYTTNNLGFWSGRPKVGAECYCYTPGGQAHGDTFNIYTLEVTSAGAITPWVAAGTAYNISPGFNAADNSSYWTWNAP